jgi:feruloyl esterase
MKKATVALLAALLIGVGVYAVRGRDAAATSCEGLASLIFPSSTITTAQTVPAGTFTPPVAPATPAERARPAAYAPPAFSNVPAFCRVVGSVETSPSTRIKFEVWMPVDTWNGNFRADGFAYFGGTMNPVVLAAAVRDGYATATTDAGGDGTAAANFLSNPEGLKDWSDRAWHETTIRAKALIKAFYGRGPQVSYWNLTGGATRQGLKSIALYPEDYDAIAAGGLTNHTTRFIFAHFWAWQATHKTPASFITAPKLRTLHDAALAACDMNDGVKDGLIHDPSTCRFDPGVVLCRNEDRDSCLTAPQVEAARKIYSRVYHSRTKELLYEQLLPGSEYDWWRPVLDPNPIPTDFAADFFQYAVLKDPHLDYRQRKVNFDSDVALADAVAFVNGAETDLRPFIKRGGKIFFYVGWNDNMSPLHSVEYYKQIAAVLGPNAADAIRLFMIPGMGHNPANGTRPYERQAPPPDGYSLDPMAVLTAWKEHGMPPQQIVVSHRTKGVEDRQLLVCPYPAVAQYTGAGSPTSAASYRCSSPTATE